MWSEGESHSSVGAKPEADRSGGVQALQIKVCGQDSLGADESADLEEQREEDGKVDEAETAQEEPAGNQVAGSPLLAAEEIRQEIGGVWA